MAAGQPYLSPALSGHVLNHQRGGEGPGRPYPGLAALTPAERRVPRLIATDLSTKETAAQLSVSL